ncbi:FISUMP domain-containing protein [Balneolales bacterium ANBcel1]|nr:FISUMP domain-containing protein [Balneolales bacterium ANBcel1]
MRYVFPTVSIQTVILILLAFLFRSTSERYEVTGVLADQDQVPVSGVPVMLFNENNEHIASDETDSQGRFTLVYQPVSTSSGSADGSEMPSEFALGASYPNPFNPRTTVPFHAPENTQAEIALYNILGQQVLRSRADVSAGNHEIQINLGGGLAQGQYILRVRGNGYSVTQKMTFISAGVGGGTPEIRVRQGGRLSSRISGDMNQVEMDIQYRIVVEQTDRFQGMAFAVTAFEDVDLGSVIIVAREDNGLWPRDAVTKVMPVTNPVTGRVWMDRNLGASRAATSSSDEEAFGDFYQWGRAADGHQKRDSYSVDELSSSDQPGHGDFIDIMDSPWDWRVPQNDFLWQGVNGTNNPCPPGYRIPTEEEWDEERQSWSTHNADGAFESPLKLPQANGRGFMGAWGNYWSSSVVGIFSRRQEFNDVRAYMSDFNRGGGISVRCIKDSEVVNPDENALYLYISPDGGGMVVGAGDYTEGTVVDIDAIDRDGYTFLNWTGDIAYVDNPGSASTTVNMPGYDISITANFGEDAYVDWPRDTETEVVEITSPATGQVWMDRNLGASRAATSSTDSLAYGNLYQWGRAADGHEKRTSSSVRRLSDYDDPGHDSFILSDAGANWDWRSPPNDNLWQGLDGTGNPCPPGFRIPTREEWEAELESWSSEDDEGAMNSPLKLPMPGFRGGGHGMLSSVGTFAGYWASTVSGTSATQLRFNEHNASLFDEGSRAGGNPVRCIKD